MDFGLLVSVIALGRAVAAALARACAGAATPRSLLRALARGLGLARAGAGAARLRSLLRTTACGRAVRGLRFALVQCGGRGALLGTVLVLARVACAARAWSHALARRVLLAVVGSWRRLCIVAACFALAENKKRGHHGAAGACADWWHAAKHRHRLLSRPRALARAWGTAARRHLARCGDSAGCRRLARCGDCADSGLLAQFSDIGITVEAAAQGSAGLPSFSRSAITLVDIPACLLCSRGTRIRAPVHGARRTGLGLGRASSSAILRRGRSTGRCVLGQVPAFSCTILRRGRSTQRCVLGQVPAFARTILRRGRSNGRCVLAQVYAFARTILRRGRSTRHLHLRQAQSICACTLWGGHSAGHSVLARVRASRFALAWCSLCFLSRRNCHARVSVRVNNRTNEVVSTRKQAIPCE